jgi:hypothetical protein
VPEKVQKTPLIAEGDYTVEMVEELAFFDLTGAKAGTQGTSNKSYHAELQVAKSGDKCQIYTIWGPTGAPNQTKEWRHYGSRSLAEKDFGAILKSKTGKGYRKIDVAQRAYGSEAAKAITKAVTLKNADAALPPPPTSTLEEPTQKLMVKLFGATQHFVATTLRCPLGQLANSQIDAGRKCLDDAKLVLNAAGARKLSTSELNQLEELTNDFYGLIPHNLGQGARGQMTQLKFDTMDKVVKKEADLDTLWDAKSVGAVLNTTSGVDAQYNELNADMQWVDPKDPLFAFMSSYFQKSKVSYHGYNQLKVKNLWKMNRKDKESHHFLENTERIAKECGKHTFVQEAKSLCKEVEVWTPERRPDLDKEQQALFAKANTWLCWHGTRSANVVGITKRGLMVRPVGAVHTGSMFGDGKYFAWQSSKSLGYTDGGYWTGNASGSTSRYMFLLDVTLGNLHLAPGSHFYKAPPKGHHSVYGKANHSQVKNDEMITYDFDQQSTQSRIKYLFEIE